MQTAFCLQKAVTGRKPCTEPSNGERGKTMAELSPMMQQYLEIKKQHKDEILFYRIGDFYEMFFEDALTASKELDLTLTGKQCGLEERAPMCGVPFHSYEGYVARLIAKGYKVAICEQVEDPAKAKGLVKRDIIRVVTPGTVIESSMLQDDRNNYIASIYLKGKKAGLCFADVSTGTAHITELAAEESCVIIGRCADYVLDGTEGLIRVFLYADIKVREERVRERNLYADKDVLKNIHRIDRERRDYNRYYAGRDRRITIF